LLMYAILYGLERRDMLFLLPLSVRESPGPYL